MAVETSSAKDILLWFSYNCSWEKRIFPMNEPKMQELGFKTSVFLQKKNLFHDCKIKDKKFLEVLVHSHGVK